MKTKWYGALGILACLASGCTDDPFAIDGPRSCDIVDQNAWVLGIMQRFYLFNEELPELDPAAYDEPAQLMADLRIAPDRWSRVSDRAKSDALYQEGRFVGLGFRTRRGADGSLVIATVHADSPAAAAGLRRGDRIGAIDGYSIAQIDEEDAWSSIYGAEEPGVGVDIEIESPGGATQGLELVKAWIEIETIPKVRIIDRPDGPIGYLVFAGFVDPAHRDLDAAFERFDHAGVHRVIVDLRYNGGGLIAVARHLVDLLLGDVAKGKVAFRTEYNADFADENSSRHIEDRDAAIEDLEHVVFITTGSTLSASELVINSVRPWVRTSIVGTDTGGKPVGSRHFEGCDKLVAPITFRLVNAEGQGDYYEGLAADCAAIDDLDHDLGDVFEASLAAAIVRLETDTCPEVEEEPSEVDPEREGWVDDRLDALRGVW